MTPRLATEVSMAEHSILHPFLDWMRQRIDEMDATVASFDAKAGQLKAEAAPKAAELLADLKRRRAQFRAKAGEELEAADGLLKAGKAQLETQWRGFEEQVDAYLRGLDKQAAQHQGTFRDVAAAQMKAWGEVQRELQAEAARLTAAQRPKVEAALEQMKTHAAEAGQRLQEFKRAGDQSWVSLNAALAESRKAFDRASREAWQALKKASSH
jgi:hypothetical protein